MKMPPFLIGASLLFWGWQTENLILASGIAIILEGSRIFKSRWEFSPEDFNRVADLCTVVFLGIVIYFIFKKNNRQIILIVLQWLPLILLPIVLLQVYSTSDKVDIGAFFLTMRKKKGYRTSILVDILYPYFAISIFSASIANSRDAGFYAGVFILCAWGLWLIRSKKFSLATWISLLLIAGSAGYIGHIGLHNLQLVIEKKSMEWFIGLMEKDADPSKSTTAMGEIGKLKLSSRILFRVKPEYEYKGPILLREASYNIYGSSTWFATRSYFDPVLPDKDGRSWGLGPDLDLYKKITVNLYLTAGKGMLKLPNGSFKILNLPVLQVEKNRLGSVRVDGGPALINYQVCFNQNRSNDSPPNKKDLTVPSKEMPALVQVIDELEPDAKSSREFLDGIDSFFKESFRYSLYQKGEREKRGSISYFLLRSRSGHCEYFATAGVLLLRTAGIPARYASGYSVQEFSRLENRFVVRSRHAHAWVLAYIDGVWQDYDFTPPSWALMEKDAFSFLEILPDLLSWSKFIFSQWRCREGNEEIRKYIIWLFIPLGIFLIFRLYTQRSVKRGTMEQIEESPLKIMPGADSEFYLIEKKITELGFPRDRGETLLSWLARIEESKPGALSTELLYGILPLHYRYRFDPHGLNPEERRVLKSMVDAWMEL